MNTDYKKFIISILLSVVWMQAQAIVDNNGDESTQYFLDYSTLERTYFDCDTWKELKNFGGLDLQINLNANCENDETGTTIEWDIENALFYNVVRVCEGMFNVYDYGYYWDTKTGQKPSDFEFDGGSIWSDYNSTYMLPGREDTFLLHPGKTMDDVKITCLEVETKEIGVQQLMPYVIHSLDAPPMHTDNENSNSSDDNDDDTYLPVDLCRVSGILDFEGRFADFLAMIYFGQYRPSDWSLRAVTHLKIHISNASYGYYDYDSINELPDSDIETTTHYYNLQGMEVSEPEPGKVYIIRNGSKTRKAVFR